MSRVCFALLAGVVLAGVVAESHARIVEGRKEWGELERIYRAVDPKDVVWGNESADSDRYGAFDPAYNTADRTRVEVLIFFNFVGSTSYWIDPVLEAWSESLPDEVAVHWIAEGRFAVKRGPWHDHVEMHQRIWFAATELGMAPDAVRRALWKRLSKRWKSLGTWNEAEEFFTATLGFEAGTFHEWGAHPVVESRRIGARNLHRRFVIVSTSAGSPSPRSFLRPMLVINGKYLLETAFIGHPVKTFQIANRLIRQEIERLPLDDAPTNDEEWADSMAPRGGEIVRRISLGKEVTGRKAVYNPHRREAWVLDDEGAVDYYWAQRGKGEDSYWVVGPEHKEGWPTGVNIWRFGSEYVGYERADGKPQRYGAFLLTDWLSSPDTHWVELAFKGKPAALAFSPDGKVEARNERGPIFGSWWLEAGELHVSLAELGVESWPWMEVAERVGFEIPPESLTPWKEGR